MKKRQMWRRFSYKKQLIISFMTVFLMELLVLHICNSLFLKDALSAKIKECLEQVVNQSAKTIDFLQDNHVSYVNQMLIDYNFGAAVQDLNSEQESELIKAKELLEGKCKELIKYQMDVRCISIVTADGTTFSYDKMQNDSMTQPTPALHKKYIESGLLGLQENVSGEWFNTVYLDRRGTKQYYVYTYAKSIYNLYTNRRVGIILISFEEDYLEGIYKNARLTEEINKNTIYITDAENNIISCEEKELIGKNIYDLESLDIFKGNSIFQANISSADWKIISVLNNEYIYGKVRDIQRLLIIISSGLALLMTGVILLEVNEMTGNVTNILHTMSDVEGGQFDAQIGINQYEKNEFTIIAQKFNVMMHTVNAQMEEIRQAGIREKEAEIRALELQINPHFIYNTLDSINWLAVENEQDEISNMLSQFARILRYQIDKSNKIVTIEQELVYLEMYLYLQKVRFSDSFEFVIQCDELVKYCLIHKMIFQPFVENAILHGFKGISYNGILEILIRNHDESSLVFEIIDNGNGMDAETKNRTIGKQREKTKSIGVENVLNRLDAYYGQEYIFSMESEVGKGTKIKIVIPKKYADWGE